MPSREERRTTSYSAACVATNTTVWAFLMTRAVSTWPSHAPSTARWCWEIRRCSRRSRCGTRSFRTAATGKPSWRARFPTSSSAWCRFRRPSSSASGTSWARGAMGREAGGTRTTRTKTTRTTAAASRSCRATRAQTAVDPSTINTSRQRRPIRSRRWHPWAPRPCQAATTTRRGLQQIPTPLARRASTTTTRRHSLGGATSSCSRLTVAWGAYRFHRTAEGVR
mmetsp:Transcript_9039/g.36955  ORF Transcript_9039/g.36955 Transcript_9039/m.36955 type:complete len:224 (+) Transcript_9039:1252-1923(+)